MAQPILMPALSPTMTEGNLAKWLKKEGDKIKPGEVIAEIETDKATMEVEAADGGILGKIIVPGKTEGVKVNQLIAIILEAGDKKDAIELIISKHSGTATSITSVVAKVESKPQAVAQGVKSTDRIFSSPLAKRIAANEGIDLTRIQGSGPKGRIIKDDVINSKRSAPVISAGRNTQEFRIEPLTQMRKVIAKRLLESKQQVPHFYLSVDCIVDELNIARDQINQRAPKQGDNPSYKISVNDFVIKACGIALAHLPEANASWSDDGMIMYSNVDISVAVAIDGGLITPIVKNADQKPLSHISNEMKTLSARAKKNELRPEEFQGGSFCISNLGMYGIKQFNAIINQPQAAIIAIGAAEKRPVVKGDKLEIATVMTLTLSCDHRVIDGALGAMLLNNIKDYLEKPSMMLV